MTRKAIFFLLAILIFAMPTRVYAGKSYTARSWDVAIDIRPDGSLQIGETTIFRFSGGPFTSVSRSLETNFVDSITNIRAFIDGQELPPGIGPGQVEIRTGNPITIIWHFSALSNSTHTFNLQYTALGAIRRSDNHDLLVWNALPARHSYAIESSRVRVIYPPTTALAGEPSVLRGQASIQKSLNEVTFQAGNVKADQPLAVSLPFLQGSLISDPPDWQRRQLMAADTISQMMPFNLIAGFAILFLGVTGFVFWRIKANHGRRSLPSVVEQIDAPPDDLPPGMAGALVSREDQVSWANALGTLFDLSANGWLRIEELPGRRLFGHSFAILFTGDAGRLASRTDNLRPHERALLEMLFETRAGRREQVGLRELRRTVSRNFNVYSEAVRQELQINGLIAAERRANRSRMILVGLTLLFIGLIGGLLSLVFTNVAAAREAWDVFRWMLLWLSSSVALFLVGMVGLMIGSAFSPLTSRGEQAGDRWRAFKRYLRAVIRGRAPLQGSPSELFEAYLPYVASFGLAESWANYFRKKGLVQPPVWFHPLAATRAGKEMSAFVTIVASASSIGTTAGGDARRAGSAGGAEDTGANGAG